MLLWEPVQTPGRENWRCLSGMLPGGGPTSTPSSFLLILPWLSYPVKMVGEAEPVPPTPTSSPEQGPAGQGDAAGVL